MSQSGVQDLSLRLGLARIISYAFVLAAIGVSLWFLFWLGIVGPIAGLPSNPAVLAEVSKVVGLLLTVEGILLGLSPIFFDRVRTRLLGAVI